MKVRIVKSEHQGYWYAEQIGSIITAFDKDGYDFHVPGCGDISKSDCEILPEENQPEPFDLERALKGDKVVTKEGYKVTNIVKFPGSVGEMCVYGVCDNGEETEVCDWNIKGKFNPRKENTSMDLFMAPRESEYVTKWVNLYAAGCAAWEHSQQEAIDSNMKTGYRGHIGTFPITFKRPS